MSTALIGLIAFVVIALAGWGIVELKNRTQTFTRSEIDIKEEAEMDEMQREKGFKEDNIRDIIKHGGNRGYDAVG